MKFNLSKTKLNKKAIVPLTAPIDPTL